MTKIPAARAITELYYICHAIIHYGVEFDVCFIYHVWLTVSVFLICLHDWTTQRHYTQISIVFKFMVAFHFYLCFVFFFILIFFFLTFFPIESHMRAYGIGRISHSVVSSTDIVVHCCEQNGHIHTSVETVWDDFYAEIYQSISCAIFDFTFIIENRWPN